ncbi:MAG: pentapeptide repeat-containing protein [Myxococcales bacterium]|nr:pentapeptide repeat-containing protein [Myxococcales bacterium]
MRSQPELSKGPEVPVRLGVSLKLTHEPAPLLSALGGAEPLDLRDGDLRDGRFAGADLRDADLRHADLRMADLQGALLSGARLNGADLTLADLRGADLQGADLSGADLQGADLREAHLAGADVTECNVVWARLHGISGAPPAWATLPRMDGRVRGVLTPTGEPQAGIDAWQRGRRAHGAAQLGHAERHYREALRWVPDSDAVRYGLGCVALERGDLARARDLLRSALAIEPGADRARFELAILEDDTKDGAALLAPLCERSDRVGEVARQVQQALLLGHRNEAAIALKGLLPKAPALTWLARHEGNLRIDDGPAPRPDDTIARLADEDWVRAERDDIADALRKREDVAAWVLHSLIARAVTIGAIDLATLAEQKLRRVAPEQRLWGAELRSLDLTAQAFDALVRTRHKALGAVKSVRWVALGAHGPTARVQCESGLFYAKRWQGGVRSAASVAFTHRVCRALAEQGLRVPLPIPDATGDDVMVFAGDLLALYPDLGGRSIRDERLDEAEATTVGRTLATIHESGAAAAGGAGRPAGGLRNGTRVLRHPNPAAAWEAAIAKDGAAARWYEHHAAKGRIESLLEAVARRLRSVVARCRVTLTHGDFGAGNVLMRPGQSVSVVDWDLAEFDLGVWDLARTIDRLAIHWPGTWGVPVELRAPIVRAIVAGYEQVRPLNDAERRALPIFVAASRIDLDASVLPLCAPLEPDSAEPILERGLQRLSRAAAGAPEIAQALWSASED